MTAVEGPSELRDRRWMLALGGGIAISALVRLAIVIRIPSPYLFADETVGVGLARAIAGADVEFFGPKGRPLLGLVLSPVAALTDSPEVLHTAGLLFNAALLTALAPVLFMTARRFLGYRIPESVTVALIGSSGAGAFATASIVRPEALITFLFTVSLPALFAVVAKPSHLRILLIPPLLAALLTAAHPRADATVVALVLALAIASTLRHIPRGSGIASIALTLVAYWLIRTLSSRLNAAVYYDQVGGYDESRILFEPLGEPLLLARALSGGSWYAMVATGGLALIALVGVIHSLASAGPKSSLPETFLFLALAGAFVLSGLFVSLILLGQVNRTDSFAYGRYIEHTFPALLLYLPRGWDQIRSPGWRRWGVAAAGSAVILLTTASSRQFYDGNYWSGEPLKSNIPALWFLWGGPDAISPTMLAIPLLGVVALTVAVAGWRHRNLVSIGLTLGLAVSGTWLVLDNEAEYSNYIKEWKSAADVLNDANAQNVALPIDSYSTLWAHNLYFWAPAAEFDHFLTLAEVPSSAEWLVTNRGVGELPRTLDGRLVASFPDQDTFIWKLD